VRLIVLCYDDSESSRHAIAAAAKLFPDAKAKVLHVWRSIESTLAFRYSAAGLTGALRDAIDELESGGREAAEEIAQRGAQLARDAGFDAEPYALEARDRVDEAVAEIVESWDASAVVVGSRGLGTFQSAALGGFSSGVVRRVHRPVVVVPSPRPQ